MDVEELLAREAIRDTLAQYTFSGDRGRVDLLARAFAPDGVLEFGDEVHRGRQAIEAALSRVGADRASRHGDGVPPFMRHNLTSSRIELAGEDAANAWSYFMVTSPVGLDHSGVYVDRLRRVDGRWLIAHRRVKVDWRAPDSMAGAPR
jgi:hypothetical protein